MEILMDIPPVSPGNGLLACRDLFFTTRICDTARALGGRMLTVAADESVRQHLLTGTFRLLIIDLDTSAALLPYVKAYRELQPDLEVISFGSHVETAVLQQAREAGCQQVLPRSRFSTQLAELLTTHLLLGPR